MGTGGVNKRKEQSLEQGIRQTSGGVPFCSKLTIRFSS